MVKGYDQYIEKHPNATTVEILNEIQDYVSFDIYVKLCVGSFLLFIIV